MTDSKSDYRVKELERKVAGLQRQVDVLHGLRNVDNKKRDREIRDLQINQAVSQGLPKKEVARIFRLSPGRITQLTRRHG